MKGIIFTLDAIFALVIVMASISILLYFSYSPHTPYSIQYVEARSITSALLSTSLRQLQNGSTQASEITNQSLGANETWPQYSGGISQAQSLYVPTRPFVSYVFDAGSAVTTAILADYGNIYFATASNLYAVNASQDRISWSDGVASISSTPVLIDGELVYAYPSGLTAVSAYSGNVIWGPMGIGTATSPLIIYNNEVVFGQQDGSIKAFYALNGTQAWSVSSGPSPVTSVVALQGSIVAENSSGYISAYAISGTSTGKLWGILQAQSIPIVTDGTEIYLGSGTTANAIFIDGTAVSGFPVNNLASAVANVAPRGDYAVYQLSQGVSLIQRHFSSASWSVTANAYLGNAVQNAIPVVSGRDVYALWQNGMTMQDLGSGAFLWFTKIPYGAPSSISAAYGRIYVSSGSKVIAYGSCSANPSRSILEAASNMYLNSFGGCADAILNSAFGLQNYSVFLGNSIRPLDAHRRLQRPGQLHHRAECGTAERLACERGVLANISSFPASSTRIVQYGDASSTGWFFDVTNNVIEFNILNGGVSTVTSNVMTSSAGKWIAVAGTFDGGTMKLYVNGSMVQSKLVSASITPPPPGAGLTVGKVSGGIANLQIYAVPLSAGQVTQIYHNGLQAAPLAVPSASAWYPLQGDANDYSPYGNSGYGVGSFIRNRELPSRLAQERFRALEDQHPDMGD